MVWTRGQNKQEFPEKMSLPTVNLAVYHLQSAVMGSCLLYMQHTLILISYLNQLFSSRSFSSGVQGPISIRDYQLFVSQVTLVPKQVPTSESTVPIILIQTKKEKSLSLNLFVHPEELEDDSSQHHITVKQMIQERISTRTPLIRLW